MRKTLLAALLTIFFSPAALAGPIDYLKGCLIVGGGGVGATYIALAQSRVDTKDQQPLLIAGMTSCIIGGFLANDVIRKAEMGVSENVALDNKRLFNQASSLHHDLCYLKGTCGANGCTAEQEKKGYCKMDLSPAGGAAKGEEKGSSRVRRLDSIN